MEKSLTKQEIFKRLGALQRVENVKSLHWNSNASVANQFILIYEHGEVFQSYNSIIAIVLNTEISYYLSNHWDYSRTTSKYRNDFLNKTTQEVKDDIKNGVAVIIEGLV